MVRPAVRPTRIAVVTGTNTEVGKTWVGAALLRELIGRGRTVAARKPAQSYDPADRATDADALGAATGEAPTTVCPATRWYPVPMAPPMAADVLGRRPVRLADLVAEITEGWPPAPVDVGLVEGVGGVWSPLADDGTTGDLATVLGADVVVVVAPTALGAINAVRLTVHALGGRPAVVFLNRYDAPDELHRRTRAWLADQDGLTVATSIPALADGVLAACGRGEETGR
jgi:dethiobiotin synthetase